MGIGVTVEVLALAVQFWRLKDFIKFVDNATNLRDESRKKLEEALKHKEEAEELFKEFESLYKIHGKSMSIKGFWQMTKKKDALIIKLGEMSDCISKYMI